MELTREGGFFVYMAAANTDKFKKTKPRKSTTLSGSVSDSDATLACADLSGWPTDTGIDVVLNRVDGNGTVQGTWEGVTAVVSGNNLTVALRGQEGTASAWAAGTVVELLWSSNTWEDAVDGILVEHDQDGTHGAITATSIDLGGTAPATTVKARAYRGSTQSGVSTGVAAKVSLGAESYDPGSNFDSTTNYEFTAPVDGYYMCSFQVSYTTATTDDGKLYAAYLYKNSSLYKKDARHAGTASEFASAGGSDIVYLEQNDTVSLYAFHKRGSDADIAGGADTTHLTVHLLSVD